MKVCKKCNSDKAVHEHHVHPKFMDNPKGFGLLLNLCRKCHHILHFIIPSIIWKYVPKKDRLKVIKEVESFALKYSENDLNKKIRDFIKEVEDGRCKNCDYELDEEDVLENWCPNCNNSINDGDKNN